MLIDGAGVADMVAEWVEKGTPGLRNKGTFLAIALANPRTNLSSSALLCSLYSLQL